MMPPLVKLLGGHFDVLPPGVHWASLAEVEARFAVNEHRAWLFEGIVQVGAALARAKCRRMFLDGSYVSDKPRPNDFDGCWDPTGVTPLLLDPVLLDFKNERAAQKSKYRGEMFISTMTNGAAPSSDPSSTYLEFLQTDKPSGLKKGIVGIYLQNDMRIRI